MSIKKTRTLITIGGVSIGIGAIVFLVSIGYGLQKLVVSRVARLDEMKQTEVTTQSGSKVKIDDKSLSDFKSLTDVDEVYPMIAVVGRVNYQNSISDMAVYGVTTGYLENSAIKPVKGKIFESDNISSDINRLNIQKQGEVAGKSSSREGVYQGQVIGYLDYEIVGGAWIRVRESPDTNGRIIGYTRRVEGTAQGKEVWGSRYESEDDSGISGIDSEGNILGKWIESNVYLWEEENGNFAPKVDESGDQIQNVGFFAQLNLYILNRYEYEEVNYDLSEYGSVLGESDTNLDVTEVPINNTLASDDLSGIVLADENVSVDSTGNVSAPTPTLRIIEGDGEWVELPDEPGYGNTEDVSSVTLGDMAVKKAVVNRAMLQLLAINEDEAIGKYFSTSFIIPTDLLSESSKKVESVATDYEIIGITPDDNTPIFYVPFIDLRSLGITNYSQVKVVSENQDSLDLIRKKIESMGFVTQSVVDTVAQINSLFDTLRVVLGVMGMIALAVASLGMFNTLTVSLLERTREVGLMKAMGMRSNEVQELFMTESLIMGFSSGFVGLAFGWIFGKLVGVLLSSIAVVKGVGFVDISEIPLSFILIIMTLSFFVGLVTGIYPSRRAKKISALNALRYE